MSLNFIIIGLRILIGSLSYPIVKEGCTDEIGYAVAGLTVRTSILKKIHII
ncbi:MULTISPECIES: hypothetical protein [Sporosarcina]|uniref:Uncharacterized protein n=1 Tax=Sporosarcina contaminans TaxID=633403 RepID=A0ABW3U157_9BACL